ncbi:MAG: hypothetical protein ABEI99_08570 [Halobaculum sp.]
MNHWSGTLAVLLLVTALGIAVAPAVAGAQDTVECKPLNGTQFCFESTSIDETKLEKGQQSEISTTIRNTGDERASVRVILNTVGPNNETESFVLGTPTLAPNESVTITQSVGARTPGTHGLQVRLVQANGSFVYDSSKIVTVQVIGDRTRLGGELDTPEFALIALIGSLAGMGYLVTQRR